MNYLYLSFLFVCFSTQAMVNDKSHLLAKPFDGKQFQAYIAMLHSQQNVVSEQSGKVIPVPSADSFDNEDEIFYANMLLIQNVQELQTTKQVPAQLSLLLQRFAILSAEPGNSHFVNRFETMLKLVVTKAAQLASTEKISQLQNDFEKEKTQVKSWQEATAFWQMLHRDTAQKLAQLHVSKEKLESEAQQKTDELKRENLDLHAQLDKTRNDLSEIGYELMMRVGQKNGLQAENNVLREKLVRVQQELDQAKKETQRKSSQNGRLKSKLKALQRASK